MNTELLVRFLKQFLFWLLFFCITRAVFLLYNFGDVHGGNFFAPFLHGLYLDISMTCYFMVIPFLLYFLMSVWPSRWPDKINRWFTLVLIACVSIVTIAELPIYDEWAHKLTFKAVWFMRNPSEVFHTATWKQLVFGLLGIALLVFAGWLLLKLLLREHFVMKRHNYITSGAFFLAIPCLLFLGIRGGWQTIPIQVSDAYYSPDNFLNNVAVNSTFAFTSSCLQSSRIERYNFLPQPEAKQVFEAMHRTEKDTTVSVFSQPHPNIVLVVLEGWSADLVKGLGGFDGITPHMDQLMQQGIAFDSCYASGSLSDQGMAAVFSAFPAQPNTSIITMPEKYIHLPCLNDQFRKAGYSSSFSFGGQLSYGNIRAYMYYNKFGRISEGKDFDASVPQGKLGAHDEYLYARQLKDLHNAKEPFFASMFTLSTHGPYDIPMRKDKLKWGGDEQDYINSAYYADSCIYNFIEGAKKEPWYKNTVFVFVSDHSHNSPKQYVHYSPEYRRIVLMMYGEPIRPEFRGYHSKKICSQIDLASTLFHQLGLDASQFRYSKNLFNPYTPQLAYYSYEGGFGFITDKGKVVYSIPDGKWPIERPKSPQDLQLLHKQGQAYLEVMFDEYLGY